MSLQRRETNDRGGTPRRAEAWRAWRTWRRDERRTTGTSRYSASRAFGLVPFRARVSPRRSRPRRASLIHETPSFLSENTTNRVVKKRPIDGTRVRGCARRHDARAVPGCPFRAHDAKVRERRRSRRSLGRSASRSARSLARTGGSVSFRSSSASRSGRRQTTDGSFPRPARNGARNGPKREGVFPEETRED